MSRYFADTETDGLLPEVSKIHSLVLQDIDTGEVTSCCAGGTKSSGDLTGERSGYFDLAYGLDLIANADLTIGHNWIDYDAPVLKKVMGFNSDPEKIEDTLVLSRLLLGGERLALSDTRQKKAGELPGNLWGRHSLDAWGYRLGMNKGSYSNDMKEKGLDPWAEWNPDMQDYCELDVRVMARLYQSIRDDIERLRTQDIDVARAIELEHQIVWVMSQQKRNGFPFDVEKAGALYADLVGKREILETDLASLFEPWYSRVESKTVTKTREVKMPEDMGTITVQRIGKTGKALAPYVGPPKTHYEEGATYSVIKRNTFNPASRAHIADRLKKFHGWEPATFTKTGLPEVNDDILVKLPYPEAKQLAKFFLLQKRTAMIAEGKQAWLKLEKDGKIHGSVNTMGAVTGRATHSHPNMSQVPSMRVPFGKECRELFYVPEHWGILLGSDQDALELRCLAGFMALWDNGAYIKTVLEGDKEKGTDLHSVNARALGLDPVRLYPVGGKQQTGRDLAKTWFYAFIYGAGNMKLGYILGAKTKGKALAIGKTSRANFLRKLPALGALTDAVKSVLKTRGYLIGLDGRKLPCRSEHSALNTLLQSAGALICKKWVVLLDAALQDAGLVHGWGGDYAFCIWSHDEVQIAVRHGIVELVSRLCKETAVMAGEYFDFACPTEADASTGHTWAETH